MEYSYGDDPFNLYQNDEYLYEDGNVELREELANFNPDDPEFFTCGDAFNYQKPYVYDLNKINKQEELDDDSSKNIQQKFKALTELNNSKEKTRFSSNFKKDGPIWNISKQFKESNKNEILIQVGRKRKNEQGGKHDKYYYDNVTRKLKTKLFEAILVILNASFKKVQIENPKKYSKKILYAKDFFLKINQEIIKDINVENNKILLKTQLKDIFSNKVSKKYERYGLDYNKKLVEKIYDERIQEKTIAILEKTFLECLEHFRGSKFYKELEGLEEEYKNVIKSFRDIGESEEYIQIFQDLANRFEDYYENKKSRNTKKSKAKDTENENENETEN